MPSNPTLALVAALLFAPIAAHAQAVKAADTPVALESFLEKQGYKAIPLHQAATGHYLIRAKMDTTPINLVLDSGAGVDWVMDKGRLNKLGIKTTAILGGAAGVGGSAGQVEGAQLSRIVLDDRMSFDSVSAKVMDLSHVNAGFQSAGQGPVDGVVGAQLLKSHGAIIDYVNNLLYLRP